MQSLSAKVNKKTETCFLFTGERRSYASSARMTLITLLADVFAWTGVAVLLSVLSDAFPALSFRPSGLFLLIPLIYFMLAEVKGLYRLVGLSPVSEIKHVFYALNVSLFVAGSAIYFLTSALVQASALVFLLAWLLLFFGILFSRWSLRILAVRLNLWGVPAVLIVSTQAQAEYVQRYFGQRSRLGIIPRLTVIPELVPGSDAATCVPLDDFLAPNSAYLQGQKSALLFIDNALFNIMASAENRERIYASFKQVVFFSDSAWVQGASLASKDFEGFIGFEVRLNAFNPATSLLKRAIDIVGAAFLLLLSAPLWLWTLLAIKLDSPGSVFYIQKRIGKGGEPFGVLKFRTMMMGADAYLKEYLAKNPAAKDEWDRTQKLVADPRITKPGKWIRKFSIDELPQLFNILKGEMSLVGPRPLPLYHHERLSESGQKTHIAITPGLTGMWQVSGRSNNGLSEMERLDAYYAHNWSLWLDIYILFRTVWVVLIQDGAY